MPTTDRLIDIACGDGVRLAARLFQPSGPPEGAIVLHGATGVPRDYYAGFAAWLAERRNSAVLIYDYRDNGHSARGPVNTAKASMGDWGVLDQGAALDFACATFPDLPIDVIGHSLGGMFLSFHERADRVRQMTAVASGPAHWARHPLKFIPQVFAFWFLAGPLVTGIKGYMPGRALGLGADLPAPVYWQWRRWCTSRTFYRVDWGNALPHPDPKRVTGKVRLIGIADDQMIPPPVVRDLAAFYPHAAIENVEIAPADVGLRAIGHLRVFSERCKAAWPVIAGLEAA